MAITTTVPTVDQTVTPLPPAPSRLGDPASFAAEGDALLSAMPTMVTQENTQKSQINTAIEAINDFATEANALATEVNSTAQLAEDYATKTGSSVQAGTYSAKEFAIGDLTVTGGSAKAWAIDTASPDGTTNKSAKSYAIDAQASAEASENSRLAAEAILDNFDDRYLGAKAVEPTLDNDGNALLSGALYFNTVLNVMKVYDSATPAWISLSFVPTAHSSLTGLANDDHTQYHNDARGDVRYYTKTQIDTNKQDKLISGTNLATVGGVNLLLGGNVPIGNAPITSNIAFSITPNPIKGANNIGIYNSVSLIASNLATLKVGNYLYLARTETLANSTEYVFIYKINLTTYSIEQMKMFTGASVTSVGQVSFKFVHDGTDLYVFSATTTGTIYNIIITKFDSSLSVVTSYKVWSQTPMPSGRLSHINYDATYWYFVAHQDTTYDATVLLRVKRDNTETKYISITGAGNLSDVYKGFAYDSTHVYFSGSGGANSKIVKVDKTAFTVTASTEFAGMFNVIGVDATYVYISKLGSYSVTRLNKTTLASVDTTNYTLTPVMYRAIQIGDYVYANGTILQLSTMDMYKFTNSIPDITMNVSQYNNDIQGTCDISESSIHLPFHVVNYSNFTFGTAYYSQNSRLSFVPALCTKSAGTNPTTSAVLTVGTPTTDAAPSLLSVFGATVNYPALGSFGYYDQV